MSKLSIALGVLLLLSGAVVAQKFPAYPVKGAAEYPTCQTKDGIRAALVLMNDKEEQKKYLGTHLSSQGFLPVLLVVENGLGESSVMLKRDLVTYYVKGAQMPGASEKNANVGVKSKAGENMATIGAIGLMATAPAAVPFMFIGLSKMSKASKIQQNIKVLELQSYTLAPHNTHSGFLYVPVGKPGAEERRIILDVTLEVYDQPATKFTFEVVMPQEESNK